MAKLLLWIQTTAVPWLGPPGVFLVAFLDASFLSLPEVGDLLVVTSGMRDPKAGWTAALMAATGSLAGSSVLWFVGRRGGEKLLSRWFSAARVEQARSAFARWDLMAVAVPAILPPPVPLKAFVVAAGVFRVSFERFASSLFLARGLRYALWAVVGIVYGRRALGILGAVDRLSGDHALLLILVLGLALVGLLAVRRRLASDARPAGHIAV